MSQRDNKRLSAAIREDVAHSGVANLVGVNETGSLMSIQLQELRDQIKAKNLSDRVPAPSSAGRSIRDEIKLLQSIIKKFEEEEKILILRSKVQESTVPLLLLQTCFSFATRMWEFAIVLIMAELSNNSIFVVSFSQFLSSFTIFALSPIMGKWLDQTNRLFAMKVILLAKVVTISVAYGFAIILLNCNLSDDGQSESIFSSICDIPHALYLVPVAAAAAHLAFAVAKMSLEKDWVVTLAVGDKEWLSSVNSKMTQIDLACQSMAPVVTGAFCSYMSYHSVSWMLLMVNMMACICFLVFLTALYDKCPALAVKPDIRENTTDRSRNSPVATKSFFTSGCAGTMISFSCLFLTVLSFGSIMIVYLRWSGMADHYVGIARGLSSLAGFSGALIYPYARGRFGLFHTGIFAIWYQVTFVLIAALGVYHFSSLNGSVIMVVAVLFSRTGLWLFDLCARQISQETIPEDSRGVINGQWASLTSFFNFGSYALACVFSDPTQFWILTTISFCMVFVAAVTFSVSYCSVHKSNIDRSDYEQILDKEMVDVLGDV